MSTSMSKAYPSTFDAAKSFFAAVAVKAFMPACVSWNRRPKRIQMAAWYTRLVRWRLSVVRYEPPGPYRLPITMSVAPAANVRNPTSMNDGSISPSPSMKPTNSPRDSAMPLRIAPPFPRRWLLVTSRTDGACRANARTTRSVPSEHPSATTMISWSRGANASSAFRSSRSMCGASLWQGKMME